MKSIEAITQAFCLGHYDDSLPDEVWPRAFRFIVANIDNLGLDAERVHTMWTVNGGHLRRKIKDDDLIRQALRFILPGYDGEGMVLYRGECRFLYDAGQIGFCWTPDQDVAAMFARGLNAIESGGVLLRAFAPAEAIFSSPNDHSSKQMGEFEFTCDPLLLHEVELIASYPINAR